MPGRATAIAAAAAAALLLLAPTAGAAPQRAPAIAPFGPVEIDTVPLPRGLVLRSATYTPSGKLLVSYAERPGESDDLIRLATMDDDGTRFRPFFAGTVAALPKANGIRFMVFADDRRIFTGDHVIECRAVLERCVDPVVLPVEYPAEIAGGDAVYFRWSEIVTAPDNAHIAWTTLIARSAMAFVGRLRRDGDRYAIADTRIVSTLDPFRPDPAHPGGVIPEPVRGGEVKQFVDGGRALSVVGMTDSDLAGSVLLDLAAGRRTTITNPPGYTETTILSPDERLGLVMTTRFSPTTNLAVLNLLPRPYPDSLNMGLNMLAYTHGVTGVRGARGGTVGPALIDLAAARRTPGYQGVDLSRGSDWVFHSPMSWHPGSRRGLWIEGRADGSLRIRKVTLPAYRAGPPVPARPTPTRMARSVTDLREVGAFVRRGLAVDVKVHGRHGGHIAYRRSATGQIEKRYERFSDDGRRVYSGVETLQPDPRGMSVYRADVTMTGAQTGAMKLTMTFGPLGGPRPAALIFDVDAAGVPRSSGFAEFGGRRVSVADLEP